MNCEIAANNSEENKTPGWFHNFGFTIGLTWSRVVVWIETYENVIENLTENLTENLIIKLNNRIKYPWAQTMVSGYLKLNNQSLLIGVVKHYVFSVM